MQSTKRRLDLEVQFDPSLDNQSQSLISRHNAGGDVSNRYGGIHLAFHHDSVECKEEPYHNVHVKIGSKSLAKKIPDGQFVGLRFDCELKMPEKKFAIDGAIAYDLQNYENVCHWDYTSKASGINDKLEILYCWFRLNGPAKNVKWRNAHYQKLA